MSGNRTEPDYAGVSGEFHYRVKAAQLDEFSKREHVSATLALPAVLAIFWVHWGLVSNLQALVWVIFMVVVLLVRVFLAQRVWAEEVNLATVLTAGRVRSGLAVVYGIGWGGGDAVLAGHGKAGFFTDVQTGRAGCRAGCVS